MTRTYALDQIGARELGRRVRDARIAAGLTQAQLADGTVSKAYISRIEKGHRRPGLKAVHLLAERLGVTVEGLVTGAQTGTLAELQLAIDHAELALAGGEVERALTEARQAEDTATSLGAEQLLCRARHVHALAEEARGNLDRAIHLLEDVVATTLHGTLAATAGIALSRCYRETGDLNRAVTSGEGILADLRERGLEGTPDYIRLTLTVTGAYRRLGDLAHAIRLTHRCIEAAEKLDSTATLAAAYWNASIYEQDRGYVAEAIELATKALNLLETGGGESNRNLANLRNVLGEIHLDADEPDLEVARELLATAGREMAWTSASPDDIGSNLVAQARAAAMAGEHELALELLEDFPEGAHEVPHLVAEHMVVKAAILLATGDEGQAHELCDRAAHAAELLGHNRMAAKIWFELGRAYRTMGQADNAHEAMERGASLYGAPKPLRISGVAPTRTSSALR